MRARGGDTGAGGVYGSHGHMYRLWFGHPTFIMYENWDFTGETKRGDKLKQCPEFLYERASVQGTMVDDSSCCSVQSSIIHLLSTGGCPSRAPRCMYVYGSLPNNPSSPSWGVGQGGLVLIYVIIKRINISRVLWTDGKGIGGKEGIMGTFRTVRVGKLYDYHG